jgi:serine/threonine transporter
MSVIKKYSETSLVLRIVIGLIIGLVLALVFPKAQWISMFGTIFVGALKAVAPVLVFVLISSALCQSREKMGKQFITIIFRYLISTFIAAFVAVIASEIFPVTLSQLGSAVEESAPQSLGDVFSTLLQSIVANPVGAIVNGNYLGILFWSVIFGIAMKSASESSKNFLNDVSDAVTKMIRWVINFAPFGIMGLMYNAISTSGMSIFTDYGKLVLLLVGCMLVSALVINPIIAFICIHRNPYPLVFKCLKNSGITAFFTRSSAANIPVNLELCEDLGLNKEIYSVSIPLGATINMDGAAITITVMALAAAHTQGIHVFLPVAVLLSIMAALGAAGTSGVAGGSLLLIPMACSLFGISTDVAMQVVGVGFIVGVIQDSMETMINSSSDVLFTAVAEYRQKRLRGEDFHF